MNHEQIDIVLTRAVSLLGIPYIWGGQSPLVGFDCSGLIVELLRSAGAVPDSADFTASELSRRGKTLRTPKPGALVFYASRVSGRIIHVELIYKVFSDGSALTIAAAGGDASVTTVKKARKRGAYVKMRAMRPNYATIKML